MTSGVARLQIDPEEYAERLRRRFAGASYPVMRGFVQAAIETGIEDGMQNFNQALFTLVKDGKVTKEEALSKLILFGEGALRKVLNEYATHYHQERNHQGKGNGLLVPRARARHSEGNSIGARERLGGLLKYYYQKAA